MDEAAFRSLVSGRRRGIVPMLTRAALRGISIPWGAAVRVRNRAFDLGISRAHTATVPVISVGNITAGGTGKTPIVACLADWFCGRGIQVAILSRGYRPLDGKGNDEKLVLDQLCPGVPHLQQPDRCDASRRAVAEFGAQVLILDDGFQHRRLARDLDIVLVDATNPFGFGHLLPRGLLREPPSALQRADVILLTRADQRAVNEKQQIIKRIRRACRGKDTPVVEADFVPQRLVGHDGGTAELSTLAAAPLAAFCGIGNPAAFRLTLASAGVHVGGESFRAFPDHHHYTPADLQSIADLAGRSQAAAILTTHKDLVKIPQHDVAGVPLWALQIAARFPAGRDALDRCLSAVCEGVVAG